MFSFGQFCCPFLVLSFLDLLLLAEREDITYGGINSLQRQQGVESSGTATVRWQTGPFKTL